MFGFSIKLYKMTINQKLIFSLFQISLGFFQVVWKYKTHISMYWHLLKLFSRCFLKMMVLLLWEALHEKDIQQPFLLFRGPCIWSYSKRLQNSVKGFWRFEGGKSLVTELLATMTVKSSGKSALGCNKHHLCRLFNFCGSQTCQLKRKDIYSFPAGESSSVLIDDGACT